MSRISRHQLYMGVAHLAAKRATCSRLNVGAVVVHGHDLVAIGYNGQEPGAEHCQGNECPGIVPGNCGTYHAEINALTKASLLLKEGSEVDLYCTHSPCRSCSEHILHSDSGVYVKRIFFEVPYRDTSHLGMFGDFKDLREVYIVTAAGYVVNYFSNKVVEVA